MKYQYVEYIIKEENVLILWIFILKLSYRLKWKSLIDLQEIVYNYTE